MNEKLEKLLKAVGDDYTSNALVKWNDDTISITPARIDCAEDYRLEHSYEEDYTDEDFERAIQELYDDYDWEEHVKYWIIAEHEGAQGVPNLERLILDAKNIEDWLRNFTDSVEEHLIAVLDE